MVQVVPASPLALYPYQKAWIQDRARLKIATKARRIGYSFATGLECVLECLERKTTQIVLSRGQRQSKEFVAESVAPHVRAIGAVAQFSDLPFGGTSIFKNEVRFGNGARIIALPANPETARSYEGDVVLDEFAFHQDARKIYEAIEPSISRGYNLTILSTPNGQQGAYYELAKESGLVDGVSKSKRWSPHKTDVFSAIAQGCADRYGIVLDAELLRSGCLDEEMWLQEYCCQFLSIAAQWIPPELFEANVDRTGDAKLGDPDPALTGMFAGWDVARNKDLSVIWVMEELGDVTWTRGLIEMRDVPTPQQMDVARRLMKQLRRMCIDKSGMGLTIFEQLNYEFGSKVEGIQFTLASKEALAVHGKRRMEELKTRIPESDMIRNSFRSVKKIVTATGQSRFDAEHDSKYGHADHWWAFTLAEEAAHQPGDGFGRWLQLSSEAKAIRDAEEADRARRALSGVLTNTPAAVVVDQQEQVGSGERFKFTDPHGILRR